MREACRLAREVLDDAIAGVRDGVTTQQIDDIVWGACMARNVYPSPLNYHGFPRAVCTSVNDVVCHGVPSPDHILRDGDIVNVDVTVFHEGFHGDNSMTVMVGGIDDVGPSLNPEGAELMRVTQCALDAAIDICRPGVAYSEIGSVIHDIADAHGYGTVRDFCGHGIGKKFHCPPMVYFYRDGPDAGIMAPGHTFTIEPMLTTGGEEVMTLSDGWTIVTRDGGQSAQYEHTLLIVEDGVERLTVTD